MGATHSLYIADSVKPPHRRVSAASAARLQARATASRHQQAPPRPPPPLPPPKYRLVQKSIVDYNGNTAVATIAGQTSISSYDLKCCPQQQTTSNDAAAVAAAAAAAVAADATAKKPYSMLNCGWSFAKRTAAAALPAFLASTSTAIATSTATITTNVGGDRAKRYDLNNNERHEANDGCLIHANSTTANTTANTSCSMSTTTTMATKIADTTHERLQLAPSMHKVTTSFRLVEQVCE